MNNFKGQHIELFTGKIPTLVSCIWEMSVNSEFIFWNQEEFSIYGLAVQAQGYIRINEAKLLLHPEDITYLSLELNNLSNQLFVRSYFRIITPSGECQIVCLEAGSEITDGKKNYIGRLSEGSNYRKVVVTETDSFAQAVTNSAEQFFQTGTWQINLQTYNTLYSPNIYRLHGVIPGSLQPHADTFKKFIHPQDRQIVTEAQDKALREQMPLHLEYRIVTESGETKYIKQISRIIRNEKAEKLMITVIQDISEGKQFELEVREAKELLSFRQEIMLFTERISHTGYWQLNLHTRKNIYSENFYKLYGLRPQLTHPVYEHFLNYTYPEDSTHVAESIRAAMEQHIPPRARYRIFRADGKVRCMQLTGKIIVNAEKEELILSVLKDITDEELLSTEIQQAREEITVLQESMKQLENATDAGTWQLNLQTGQPNFSANFYHIHGLKPQTAPDGFKKFEKFIHFEDRKLLKHVLSKAFTEKLSAPVKFRIVTTEGQHRFIQLENKVIVNNRNERMLIGSMRNTTEDELLRRQLKMQTSFLNLLSDTMIDKYLVTDVNNNIQFFNKRFEEHYKIKSDDVTGSNLFDTLPPMKHPDVIKHLKDVLSDQAVLIPKLHCIIAHEFLVIQSVPLKDPEGNVTGVLSIAHDVTPESNLQEQLSKRMHVIENLVENTIDRIIVLDENMDFLIWNKKCEEHYGLSKEQVTGKNVLEIFPFFKIDPAYQNCIQALSGEAVYVPAAKSTVSEGYNEQYVLPLRDEKENVYAVLWIVHDLTKEFQLTFDKGRAHMILDAIDEGCFELDCEKQCFRYFNAKAQQMLNLSPEQLMGKCIWEVFPLMKHTQLYTAVMHVCEGNPSYQKEYFSELLQKWVYLNVTRSEGGVVVLILDMQAKKDAENKVQESFEQWRALVENIPDLITRWNKDMKLIYANQAFESKTRIPFSSLLNKTSLEIGQPDHLALLYEEALKEVFTTGVQKDYFNYFVLPEGLCYFHYRMVPEFAVNGSVQNVLTLARDITQLKITEDAIQKSRRFTS